MVHKCIFVLLGSYCAQVLTPNFLKQGKETFFVERPSTRLGSALYYVNLDALNPKKFSDQAPNHGGFPPVSLNYLVDVYICPKTMGTTLTNWLCIIQLFSDLQKTKMLFLSYLTVLM